MAKKTATKRFKLVERVSEFQACVIDAVDRDGRESNPEWMTDQAKRATVSEP